MCYIDNVGQLLEMESREKMSFFSSVGGTDVSIKTLPKVRGCL